MILGGGVVDGCWPSLTTLGGGGGGGGILGVLSLSLILINF